MIAATPALLRGKRIILVEANDALFCALKDALEDAGCEVVGSPLSEACLLVPFANADAALVDNASADAAFEALARVLAERQIPTIFIAPEPPGGMLSRWQTHLRKPFTEQELLQSVCAAVGKQMAAA